MLDVFFQAVTIKNDFMPDYADDFRVKAVRKFFGDIRNIVLGVI